MSDYLVQRIDASPNITLHTETEITALDGDTMLSSVTWNESRHRRERDACDAATCSS